MNTVVFLALLPDNGHVPTRLRELKGQAAAEADVPSAAPHPHKKKKKKRTLYVESTFDFTVYFEAPRCGEHVDVL